MADPSEKPRLWTRDYRLLASGLLVSYIGDAFFAIGFTWLALQMTGDPRVVGAILALYGLPTVLIGPFMGSLVDAWNKRWIMLFGDGARGCIVLAVYAAYRLHALSLWGLLAAALSLSICDVLYKPSLRMLIPTLVDNSLLPKANAFVQGSDQFAKIVGATAAGIVVAAWGSGVTMVIDAASFLVSAGALYLVRFAPRLTGASSPTLSQVWRKTWDGLRYCFQQPELLQILLLTFGMNLAMSPVNVILPVFSRDTIGAGPTGFGWLSGAIGTGMVGGSLLAGAVAARLRPWQMIGTGVTVLVCGFLGLSVAGSVVPAVVLTGVLGLGVPFVQVPLVTQLQRQVPAQMQGRTFATVGTVSAAAAPLGAALAGTALRTLRPPAVFLIAAVGLVVVSCGLLIHRRLSAPPFGGSRSRPA